MTCKNRQSFPKISVPKVSNLVLFFQAFINFLNIYGEISGMPYRWIIHNFAAKLLRHSSLALHINHFSGNKEKYEPR